MKSNTESAGAQPALTCPKPKAGLHPGGSDGKEVHGWVRELSRCDTASAGASYGCHIRVVERRAQTATEAC